MSFLSLSHGDPVARALLQRAVVARYGPRPLLPDSLRIRMEARSRGPLGLPSLQQVELCYVGLANWYREEVRKILGLRVSTVRESFDGANYYLVRGRQVAVVNDEQSIASARQRLWANRAIFLTPLTQQGVRLKNLDNRSFQAYPEGQPSDVVTVRLNENDSIDTVEITRYNAEAKRVMRYGIKLEGGLQTINSFFVPQQMALQWDGQTTQAYQVTAAEPNPAVEMSVFAAKGK